MRRYLYGPAALFFSLLIALPLVEVGLRTFRPVGYRSPGGEEVEAGWKGAIHQASPVPGLIYELAPSRQISVGGIRHTTNSHGMRDREPIRRTGQPIRRLAVLGDSVTYGYGVGDDENFPSVLEKMLNEAAGDTEIEYEVLNFGVGGYSTRDETLTLKHKALAFDPGMVLICYDLNDPEIDPVQPITNHFRKPLWWEHSHLLRLLAKAKRDWDLKRLGGGDYFRYLHNHPRKWQSVRRAFDDIAEMAASRNLPVMFVIWTWTKDDTWADYEYADLLEQVESDALERGFYVVDLFKRLSQNNPRSLTISDMDMHPSVRGHEVIAGAVVEALGMNNVIDREPLPREEG